jgi:hypothetical protein
LEQDSALLECPDPNRFADRLTEWVVGGALAAQRLFAFGELRGERPVMRGVREQASAEVFLHFGDC